MRGAANQVLAAIRRMQPRKKRARKITPMAKRVPQKRGMMGRVQRALGSSVFQKPQKLKFFDKDGSITNLSTTPGIIAPGLIAQGIDEGQRIGDNIQMRSITYHIEVSTSGGIPSNGATLRLALVYWRDSHGVTPLPAGAAAVTNAFWLTTTTFGALDHTLDHRHPLSVQDMVCIKEWRLHIGSFVVATNTFGNPSQDQRRFGRIKLANLHTHYITPAAATPAAIDKGLLFFACCCDADNVTLDIVTRLCYGDA